MWREREPEGEKVEIEDRMCQWGKEEEELRISLFPPASVCFSFSFRKSRHAKTEKKKR